MTISAICFDMWGTLIKGGGVELWQELQIILNAQSISIRDFIKIGEKTTMIHPYSLKKGIEKFSDRLQIKIPQKNIKKAYNHWWSYVEIAHPYEEIESVLEKIHRMNVRTSIISNTDASSFNFVIKKFHWQKYFEKFFLSSEIGVLKPDVKIFSTVQEYLALPKEQIIMVDDSLTHGVYPARRFGWQVLWVARQKEGKDENRIEDLRGILDFL